MSRYLASIVFRLKKVTHVSLKSNQKNSVITLLFSTISFPQAIQTGLKLMYKQNRLLKDIISRGKKLLII